MKKLDYIDSLRGLAILGVLIVHTSKSGAYDLPAIVVKFTNEGARGVQLFFLASAFTLFLSYKNRSSVEKFPLRNFFIRRFFRIAPIYYLGIAYYLFQNGMGPSYWLGDSPGISAMNIASNATFTHGFNPYWINSVVPGGWSIAVEMTFYAILPLLFARIKNLNQAVTFLLLTLLFRTILQLIFERYILISHEELWGEFQFLYFPNHLPLFSLGIILFFMVIEKESLRDVSKLSLLIISGVFMAQLCIKTPILLPNHFMFGVAFLLLGYALSAYRFKILVNPVVNHIGKISFSMYVTHFAILYWLNYFNLIDYSDNSILNFVIRFAIVLTSSVIISTMLYKLIEVPFQNLGKKIIKRKENLIA